MPQINQLAQVAYSQFFWLLLVLGIIYVGIGLFMLPKIQATVDARGARMETDLAAAQAARGEADSVEAAYRARLDESRGEALRLAAEAKAAAARDNEQRVRAAGEEINAGIGAAEARIRASSEAALGEIEAVAAEAAQDMVQRLAGLTVSREQAARAVKAVAHG
ncbi:MAG: ATPase [Alphaproteobacteria bacterium]|nr:ATPase [Alphaproteobacteria bacterium]MBV9372814.1 ATPase [Alphaproteobacteria bacterium]MBV9900491.1 ATPase [Alphaproteobacteria bacterium]